MKIATQKGLKCDDSKIYHYVVLTTIEDLDIYKSIDAQIKSHQSFNLWKGFKSQNFRDDLTNYAVHELESGNNMGYLMARRADMLAVDKGRISIVDYCNLADGIMNDMYLMMYNFISKGQFVRINNKGGYCPIDDLKKYNKITDINEQELYNYLLNGDVNTKLEIVGESVVLENESYIPKSVVERYCKLMGEDPNNLQIITSFKHKCILFKDNDYIALFRNGVNNGMRNIIFETTAQDVDNIQKLINAFSFVAKRNKEITFNIYYSVWGYHKGNLFTTELPNVVLHKMER